jgi:phosphonoacetate hydrolase
VTGSSRPKSMKSIVIFVIDGLRPDQVIPSLMPNLSDFAAEGTTFLNHRSVFPTLTRVNLPTFLTGCQPGTHGIAGNDFVARDFHPTRIIPVLEKPLKEVRDSVGEVVFVPHLADTLSENGLSYAAVGLGGTGAGFMHNPREREGAFVAYPEYHFPPYLGTELSHRSGPWPKTDYPDEARVRHGIELLTKGLIEAYEPTVSLFWSSEPDHSQHHSGINSDLSLQSLRVVDEGFGDLLAWLQATGRDGSTDVVAVSDHGYSTSLGLVNVEHELRQAGFPEADQPGGVVWIPNGGSAFFYSANRDTETLDRLAVWLMGQDWCGPIVSSARAGDINGTLPMALVGCEGLRAPDLIASMAWDSEQNEARVPGRSFSTLYPSGIAFDEGQGHHASMSNYDLHNVMIARGPSFRSGASIDTPTGNVDVTPTVLHILEIPKAKPMDGRVIYEALQGNTDLPAPTVRPEVHRAQRKLSGGEYHQEISVSIVNDTVYVDEGRVA